MAATDPETKEAGGSLRVVAQSRITAEWTSTAAQSSTIFSESVAAVAADGAARLGWLDTIEEALHELRSAQPDAPELTEAAALAARLRQAARVGLVSGAAEKALWVSLYAAIAVPFLRHFGAAAGDELGRAAAHRIVEVLSSVQHFLNP